MSRSFISLSVAIFLMSAPAFAYTRDQLACNQGNDVELRISGCTGLINSRSEPLRNRGMAYNNRSIAWMVKGDAQRALSDAEASLRIDPGNAAAYNSRGNALNELKRYDEAIPDFDRAIKGLSSWVPYNGRALAWYGKGEYRKSIADATEALRRNPKAAFAYNTRGGAYNKAHEADLAIADFSKAIEISPGFSYPYNGRALAYQEKEEIDKAMDDFNQAIRLDPKKPLPFDNRAVLWMTKGEFDIALADFNEAF